MVIIYALRCSANGMVYIGSTRDRHERTKGRPYQGLAKRFREHRCRLRAGDHAASRLQQDWLQYGEDAFETIVLDRVFDALPIRREAEERCMRTYRERGLLYNEHLISMRPTDEAIRLGVANAHREAGNRWTPEANLKRRLAQLGKPKGHGAKISATKRANRANDEIV
jgi:hypothetical protein